MWQVGYYALCRANRSTLLVIKIVPFGDFVREGQLDKSSGAWWRGQGRHQSIATVGCPRKVNSDGPRSHLSPGTTGARRSPVVVGPNPLRAMWPSCQARGVKVKDATSPRHSASTAVCLSPHLSHSA